MNARSSITFLVVFSTSGGGIMAVANDQGLLTRDHGFFCGISISAYM